MNVTAGAQIQETGVFGTLNMNAAIASPSAAPSGYTISVFGGNAHIANSTVTGPGGLAVSGFFGVPGSAIVADSAIEGTSQAVLIQHGSTLDMAGGTVKGGTHGFELINGADVTIDGTTVTSGGVGILAYAGSSTGAIGSTVKVHNAKIGTVGVGVELHDGSNADLVDTVIKTTAIDAHGIHARSGATINAERVDVTTSGERAYGAFAEGNSSQINLYGGIYTTSGYAAFGVVATNAATLTIGRDPASGAGTLINTTGDSAIGVYAKSDGAITIDGATIKTDGGGAGSWAVGVYAIGGGTVDMTDTKIETTGIYGSGMNAEGAGSHVNMVRGSITAAGPTSGDGATAFGDGKITLSDVIVSVDDGRGVVAGDPGSSLTMAGGSVTTKGNGVGSSPANSAAFAVRGALVDLTGVRVRTEGDDARGLHAFNVGSVVNATSSLVSTLGTGSHGGFASSGGAVNVINSEVTTRGMAAHGLLAQGGSSATATNSVIKTEGENAAGLYVTTDSTAVLDKSVITTANGPALQNGGGDATFDLKNGTQAVGGNGTVLTATAGSTTTVMVDGGSYIGGDMIAEASDTVIDASLTDGSQWFGAAKGVTTVAVDGTSYWLMTGSSDVGSLTNDGTVEFDAANPYKTLTAATLDVNGGSFILKTKLNEGGAASETDKIIVSGDANGNGLINIRNNGGTGAFTGTGATDGIQVIQVGGASDAEFQLGSAAVVGIYDYQLKKADGQNWYLQTEGSDIVDPGDGSGGNPGPGNPGGGGESPGTGHVVDIVPGYNIALSAAQNHVLTTLDTFHERLGELRSEDLQDGFHAWMRGIGKTGSYSPKSITGYNGHGFDMTTAGVQVGVDYSKGDVFVAGDKLTVGIFGEYANSSFYVRGRTADGSISSKGLGGYVTWQQKAPTDRKPGTGAYVDAVVKHDWLDFGVNAKSVSGFDLRNGYKGKATSASIEAGYGFDLGNNVVLQPQAQLAWSKIKADGFTDNYGIAVHGQEAESLIGRVGVRLEKTFYFGDEEETLEVAPAKSMKPAKNAKGKKGAKEKTAIVPLPEAPKKKKFVKSVTTFADANAKREFKGKNGLVASGTGIGNDMGGTRYDVGVGVVARVSENVSLFGRGAVEFGGSTNVAGKVSGGVKITW